MFNKKLFSFFILPASEKGNGMTFFFTAKWERQDICPSYVMDFLLFREENTAERGNHFQFKTIWNSNFYHHYNPPNNLQDAIAFHIFRFQNSSVRKYRSVEIGQKFDSPVILIFLTEKTGRILVVFCIVRYGMYRSLPGEIWEEIFWQASLLIIWTGFPVSG